MKFDKKRIIDFMHNTYLRLLPLGLLIYLII